MLTPIKKHEIIIMLASEPEKYYTEEEILAILFDHLYDDYKKLNDYELENKYRNYCKRHNITPEETK